MRRRVRRGSQTKKKSQTIHARRRALERYGIIVGPKAIKEIVNTIQRKRGGAEFVKRRTSRITIFDVPFRGKRVRVVYDSQRKNIVSFLSLKKKKEK